MATIITSPADFSSLRKGLIFELNRGTVDIYADIQVGANGIKGIKQISGKTARVNVADYFKEDITILPVLSTEFRSGYTNLARYTSAQITVDGVTSRAVVCVNSVDAISAGQVVLSDMDVRHITYGQCDEIAIKGAGYTVAFNGKTVVTPGAFNLVTIPCPPESAGLKKFQVVITGPSSFRKEINYTIDAFKGVRLGWINRYGQIDYWNFDLPLFKSIELDKSSIYTQDGYRQTGVTAEEFTTIKTRCLDSKILDNLKWLLVSDQVWQVNTTTYQEIVLLTNKAGLDSNTDIMSMQVEFKPKKRLL